MKIGALVFSLLLTPWVSVAEECHTTSDKNARIKCLNQYGQALLTEDSPAGVRDRYYEELRLVLESASVKQFDLSKTQALANAFEIVVPQVKDVLDASEEGCFDFAKGDQKSLDEDIQMQMKEISYFLKTFHAWSLGNRSSHLFQIRRVEVCSADKKSIQFNKGILRVNIAFGWTKTHSYTAKDILKDWNSGDVVFGPSMGFIRQKITAMKGDTGAVIKAKLRPAWLALNPIGDVRYQLRLALQKQTGQALSEIFAHRSGLQNSLNAKSEELGLTPVSLSDSEAENVASSFKKTLENPEFLNQAIEQILVATNGGSHSISVEDNRVNIGLIAVKNSKQIGINVGSLFPSPLEMDEELQEAQEESVNQVTAQLNGKNIGLIAVDLFDQVAVNVVPPNILKLIEKISLKKALKNRDRNVSPSSPTIKPSAELISI